MYSEEFAVWSWSVSAKYLCTILGFKLKFMLYDRNLLLLSSSNFVFNAIQLIPSNRIQVLE